VNVTVTLSPTMTFSPVLALRAFLGFCLFNCTLG